MLSSDQQIPHCDWRAIDLWFQVMQSFKPHHIVYAGDWTDNTPQGRWVDGGSQEFLNTLEPMDLTDEHVVGKMLEQEQATYEFFKRTRALSPKAHVLCAGGNHDYTRVVKYFDKKAPLALEKLTPDSLWGFKNLGFDYIDYEDRPKHFAGGFYVHHGVAISKHAGESVKADVENFGVSLIRGHSHRQAIINRTYTLRNETITGVELGHFMDIDGAGASYDNVHNWQMGFAVGYIEDGATDTIDGKRLHLELVPISRDYTCVVGGRLYRG